MPHTPGSASLPMTLTGQKALNEKEFLISLESKTGLHRKAEMVLDRRGRAEKLMVGEPYTVDILSEERFYHLYEKKSIEAGKAGRSEPKGTGAQRMKIFSELCRAGQGDIVLDCATGMKEYLKDFADRKAVLVCMNISVPVLKRTGEWLSYPDSFAVRYNADAGLPFKDRTFDHIIVDALLEYTSDPTSFLSQCAKLLKSGGALLLLEPAQSHNGDEFYPQDLWEFALWRPRHDRAFSKTMFQEALRREGLERSDNREIEFEYALYRTEKFTQGISTYIKI